jgi:hypothetical protein
MALPDDRLVFSGEITRAESNAALRWYSIRLRRHGQLPLVERLVMAIVAVIAVLAVPFIIIALQPDDVALVGMIAALFGFFLAIVVIRVTNLRFMQRVQQLRTSNIGRSTFTFGPDGYGVETPSGATSLTPWRAVKQVEITPQSIALWHDGYAVQIFPRALVDEPSRDAELLAAIRTWTSPAPSETEADKPR